MVGSAPNNILSNPWPDVGNEGEGYPLTSIENGVTEGSLPSACQG